MKHQYDIYYEYEYKIKEKLTEYNENFNKFHFYYQTNINQIEEKVKDLENLKLNIKHECENKLKNLIKNNNYLINQFNLNNIEKYKNLLIHFNLIKSNIKNLNRNRNKQIQSINHSYKFNTKFIYLSFKQKINNIKNCFIQVNFLFEL